MDKESSDLIVEKDREDTGNTRLDEKDAPAGIENVIGFNPNYFLFGLILLLLFGCYLIVLPYIHTIILAAILSLIFRPVYKKILVLCRGKKNLSAFVSCLVLTIAVVLPLLFIFLSMVQQGIQSFNSIYDWIEAGKYMAVIEHPITRNILERIQGLLPDVQKFFPDFEFQKIRFDKIALEFSAATGKILLNQGKHLAGNISSLIGKFFLFLFTFFFFVRDQKEMIASLFHLLPLSTSQEEKIISKVKSVTKSALLGTLVTAVAQGAAGGIAFWAAGLPGLFWGMMMAFASLVPLVGTALIWLPASLFLVISGKWMMGAGVAVWCLVVVGSIDNFVRPLFMQGSADMSTLLIFFSILGGINLFGLIGLLYGPLIFGLAMVLLFIYSVEFETFLDRQDNR